MKGNHRNLVDLSICKYLWLNYFYEHFRALYKSDLLSDEVIVNQVPKTSIELNETDIPRNISKSESRFNINYDNNNNKIDNSPKAIEDLSKLSVKVKKLPLESVIKLVSEFRKAGSIYYARKQYETAILCYSACLQCMDGFGGDIIGELF